MHNEAGEKLEELNILDQIDEALEEREGTDRRKQDKGRIQASEDRRKQDRRTTSAEDA
ncbi:MAG: hypothetical protein WBN40_09205 [Pseudomonadales bacterium]